MLKFLLSKIQISCALYHVFLYTRICDKSRKLHINYDVTGVASITAQDKLELHDDVIEVFYESPLSAHLRVNESLQQRQGLLKTADQFSDDVDYDSFQAVLIDSSGVERKLNRTEFEAYELGKGLRGSKSTIVFPDGSRTFGESVDSRIQKRQLRGTVSKSYQPTFNGFENSYA